MKQYTWTVASLPSPLRLFLTVLVIVFLAEAAVMFLLPVLLPGVEGLAGAIADASILTVLSAPFLWWFIVRPLCSTAMAEQARAVTIVAHSSDGIITINEQGLVESFNQAAECLFGYREEEVLGKPLNFLMPERYRDAHRRGLERVRSTGESHLIGKTIELYGLRKDGSEFPLELSLAAWKTAKGAFYTGIIRDITERKQVERALEARVRQWETVVGLCQRALAGADPSTLMDEAVALVAQRRTFTQDDVQFLQVVSNVLLAAIQRRRAEEALRESEERFASFMSHLPGLAWMKDAEGRYVYINESYEKTFHMKLSDLCGKTDDEVWPPAIAAQYQENDRQVMRSRAALQTIETALHDDGLHYWLVCKFPILDENGTPAMVGGAAVDITDQKRMEETLQALYLASLAIQEPLALRARLGRLLQVARDVLHMDRLNILLADSAGQWLEMVASTEAGEPLETLRVPIGPEGGGLAQAYRTQQPIVWDGQGPVPEALRLKPPYDQVKAIRSQAFIILPLVVHGRVIGVLATDRRTSRRPFEPALLGLLQLFATQAALAIEHARLYEQVTRHAEELEQRVEERTRALQEAQAQLVQSAKLAALGTLAAGVAHELNQPLTVIRGYAQALMADDRLDLETKADLDRIQAQTTRMARIINHLRDFSRQSHGTFEPLALNQVIEDSFTLLSQQLQARNIEVVKALDPGLPMIPGDRFQLEQVFINLITNARDAMQPQGGGRLTVTTRVAGGFVEAAVADTGPGIPEAIRDLIFDPFFTTKEVGQGTGLGLSISYGIITQHGGEIRVENRPEGGAVFVVRLPITKHAAGVERQESRSGA